MLGVAVGDPLRSPLTVRLAPDWMTLNLVEIPVHDADLSTSGAPSLVDVPPFLRTEGHLIEKLFVVVAAALLGSTLQWGSDFLTY